MRGAPQKFLTTLPSRYTRAAAADLATFRSILGDANVLAGHANDAARYNLDWMKQYEGRSACVLRPGSTAEVAAVLAHCSARRIPVVPQGGNTGLVGGAVPLDHEVVLSTERLRALHSFDADSGVAVCGGGMVLQALDEALAPHGWMVPLDLGSKGSCAVGGNVSTNAGGLRLLRHGSLHGSVLGVEAVTGEGEVLDMLCTLRKDNVGFDVKQLFIGSEGALGVVTRVALQAVARPAALNVALLGAGSFEDCIALLRLARRRLGEVLSAAEFVDARAMALCVAGLGLRLPFATPAPFFFFVETSGSHGAHDAEKLSAFLEEAAGAGLAVDGAVAADSAQARSLWRLREDVSVAVSKRGHVYKCERRAPQPPRPHDVFLSPRSGARRAPTPRLTRAAPPPPPPCATCRRRVAAPAPHVRPGGGGARAPAGAGLGPRGRVARGLRAPGRRQLAPQHLHARARRALPRQAARRH